ncbi:hypothetical protein FN846DRAFT_957712 [Sphaerosporella brunnea]|uniref:Uncharacterized protein n=1 Tax=Sphaerosporella brunnea TaxID=1250544 RepID=A0A5J5ES48_9PEZI|nr:hypothetical protein FN846DRAFT_957712 [Sphaerosporella brunnea]
MSLPIPYPAPKIPSGDTLVFFRRFSPILPTATPHLQAHSSTLLATGSELLQRYLSPTYQHRIRRRTQLQQHGLPTGVNYVIDLTPPEEGDAAVEIVEKLWCPDEVRGWKPWGCGAYIEEDDGWVGIARPNEELDIFFQEQWGPPRKDEGWVEKMVEKKEQKTPVPDLAPPYSVPRHIGALQRIFGILHGIDPHINSCSMWYTIYALSVEMGLQAFVVDYLLAWLYSPRNVAFTELFTPLAMTMAERLQSQVLSRECMALTISRNLLSTTKCHSIYRVKASDLMERHRGAIEAATASLRSRIEQQWDEIMSLRWLDDAAIIPTMSVLNSLTADIQEHPGKYAVYFVNEVKRLDALIRGDISTSLLDIANGAGETPLSPPAPPEHIPHASWDVWRTMVFSDDFVGNPKFNRYAWLQIRDLKLLTQWPMFPNVFGRLQWGPEHCLTSPAARSDTAGIEKNDPPYPVAVSSPPPQPPTTEKSTLELRPSPAWTEPDPWGSDPTTETSTLELRPYPAWAEPDTTTFWESDPHPIPSPTTPVVDDDDDDKKPPPLSHTDAQLPFTVPQLIHECRRYLRNQAAEICQNTVAVEWMNFQLLACFSDKEWEAAEHVEDADGDGDGEESVAGSFSSFEVVGSDEEWVSD